MPDARMPVIPTLHSAAAILSKHGGQGTPCAAMVAVGCNAELDLRCFSCVRRLDIEHIDFEASGHRRPTSTCAAAIVGRSSGDGDVVRCCLCAVRAAPCELS